MSIYSSNHHKIKWLRNGIVSVMVIGLLGGVFTIGSARSEASIQSPSASNYHPSYFVIANPTLVIAVVAGTGVGIALGIPLTAKLYANVLRAIQ
ncbi:hypothetical protein PaeCFBP13512_05065 [Paenibacillus sp. CFBP13512]|uniref:hypothetical protein n=1 Tax=Paenibacillus sp. CFBP13512 TaxID=2184007 RepID=UPI0010C01ABB|nr:hypothetical protein [Paenibacillus sp. CFBP13512]TKJ92728.1 hypothetical protein PaeCFBP13512_05065 [Paenibacillus sp. CFBP13512]